MRSIENPSQEGSGLIIWVTLWQACIELFGLHNSSSIPTCGHMTLPCSLDPLFPHPGICIIDYMKHVSGTTSWEQMIQECLVMVAFGTWNFKRAREHFALWFNRNRSEVCFPERRAHVLVARLCPPGWPWQLPSSSTPSLSALIHAKMISGTSAFSHAGRQAERTSCRRKYQDRPLLGTNRHCAGLTVQNHRHGPSMEQAVEAVNAAENFCSAFHVSQGQPPVCWGRVWTSWCK